MKRWHRVMLMASMLACACPSKPTAPNNGSQGTGSDVTTPPVQPSNATTCNEVKARVEQLYRAEAQIKEPKRVEDAVADNTAMAMADCAKDPAKTVPCLASAATVADLEKRCLVPLDDEGTEGEAVRK
jgi:hypothetical protein